MLQSLFKKQAKPEPTLAHDTFFNSLREKEYSRLDKDGHVYLDYTGGNLYASSQLAQHFKMLEQNVLGNPHSSNPTSSLSTKLVAEARQKVLDFFNADDYYCVFTSNASNALKIVGECYPFSEDAHFLLFADNHNSVNGIREYCRKAAGQFDYVPMNVEDLSVASATLEELLQNSKKAHKLFAFPAQSNVSGIKHDLNWIEKAKAKGWDVLLDAAAYVPTSTLDLKQYRPDYVSMSFYKIFGYPTGLGALLIRKESFAKLHKRWFAGGTVTLAAVNAPFHFLIDNHERFENGTINYLDIPAIKIGLDYVESIGMERINERVNGLMNYLHRELKSMEHSNGIAQVDLFGHPERANTGGTLILCFKNPDGQKIPFETIEAMTNKKNISLRSGCFCNPGLDETNNCLTNEELASYFESRESGSYNEMIKHLNKMRGATRISVGLATVKRDLDIFLDFVRSLKDQVIA